ncbi:FMN-dependent oxidoreductase (nitrilotriacetate monooxygenase family) [Sphingopyxis panaciterrae]|uniref:LLM class flavin-dependent oxidoreductase n=1 Tax=Sphingopyxis panaciterrae TaxID=363841 RepID=UPI00141E7644|nr:LLM class flavin-dependent oxidoreductase [Sphingopyxis panaciterrae]NIJ37545.1 FMN-dependent oxidoreductase (nitrilotriacetate monooxygenase family) [Sphingopyxis panaciterrae]
MRSGQMKFGVMLDGIGGSHWGWRRAHIDPKASTDIDAFIAEAQSAEAAKADFLFIADTLSITAKSSPHFLNRLEPMTLLGALASHTKHIGLVGTLSTSFTEPFTVARQLASLDRISQGRAGWNIVTSALEGAAHNHSQENLPPVEDRYRRALEHVRVVEALWDSWEDDAFVPDKATGVFFDPSKLHPLMHQGEFFRVDGPLNIARSPQGHPVLFQAGASDGGRDLAAKTADAIFGLARTVEDAKEYCDDVKRRAVGFGRSADDIVFMPGLDAIVAETEEEAERKYAEACAYVSYEESLGWISFFFSYHDFNQYDPDAPFPELGNLGKNSYRSVTDYLKRIAREEKLTLRQLARRFAIPRTDFIGSAEKVADSCQRWFEAGAVDGFLLSASVGRLQDFYDLVVPILQKRGLFKEDYEASTFRGHLGLPAVPNRHAQARETLR